jgi:hypothetical protein
LFAPATDVNARAFKVTLNPGDVLFVPALWLHHVTAGAVDDDDDDDDDVGDDGNNDSDDGNDDENDGSGDPWSLSLNVWSDGAEFAAGNQLLKTTPPIDMKASVATKVTTIRLYLHIIAMNYYSERRDAYCADANAGTVGGGGGSGAECGDLTTVYARDVLSLWRDAYATRFATVKNTVFDVVRASDKDNGKAAATRQMLRRLCGVGGAAFATQLQEAYDDETPCVSANDAACLVRKGPFDESIFSADEMAADERGKRGKRIGGGGTAGDVDVNYDSITLTNMVRLMYTKAAAHAAALGKLSDNGGAELLLLQLAEVAAKAVVGDGNVDTFFGACLARL